MSGTAPGPTVRTVPLDDGETLGGAADSRWRVVRHVADGGFSSVYEVRPATPETVDRHGAAPRALKCVWGTPAELTAMNSEAARTRDVDGHPGVLTFVTSFRFERPAPPHHHVGLVLELADEDLPTFGARTRPGERAWAAVFEQVAAGLAHTHARRVVHGDIKPTNLLRIGGRFVVADFGVSAPLESTRSAGIGLARTIAFWPPESATQGVLQADGVRRPPVEGWRASQAGDVWALAVSAHRMLTGRHITAGTTPEQQYELVCLGRYAVDGRLSPGWRRLLEDCLGHDPARRRVTASEQLRERLAELAVPPAYAGARWPAGAPRLAALVDLDPAAGGPLLALSVDRPRGRVSGELVPATGVLPAALRHLTEDVLPGLAAPTTAPPPADPDPDPAATQVVPLAELERTRQQLTRSRDDALADRDRLRRDHDALARRLDRLEREAGLRRPPAVEQERTAVLGRDATAVPAPGQPSERGRRYEKPDRRYVPAGAYDRTRVAEPGSREPTRVVEPGSRDRTRVAEPGSREPTRVVEPPRREPTRAYEPEPAAVPAREEARWRPAARPSTRDTPPAPAPARAPRRPLFRRTRRMIRRLVTLLVVLATLAVLGVTGIAAVLDTSPAVVLDRVAVVLEQVRNGGT